MSVSFGYFVINYFTDCLQPPSSVRVRFTITLLPFSNFMQQVNKQENNQLQVSFNIASNKKL